MTAQPDDDELPIIDFVSPMPGFPEHRRFVLVRLDDDGLLYVLTSLHDSEVRFPVVPPSAFFRDYSPEIPQDTADLLGVTDPDEVLVLLVITAGESVAESTANLLAPILINRDSRSAAQVVLSGSGLPVRAELVAVA
jgi:flagellar assembly factor FliW